MKVFYSKVTSTFVSHYTFEHRFNTNRMKYLEFHNFSPLVDTPTIRGISVRTNAQERGI